uniref:Mo-dependent nitrogenase C-terminal domain-containing protein n=1 Tax=Trichocoleus desertorum TaxID=1481672 RepID=UPI0025B476D5|nr:Mo-dependent nitrogenase C-terminal domain-containing protein [Trichocoleus desertorum]
MSDLVQSPPTNDQISAWLRGLLAIAWADGNFDPEEQDLITSLTQQDLAPATSLGAMAAITPSELAASLGQSDEIAQHFLRTAVMVAIADGIYSAQEDGLLEQFCQALGQSLEVLEALRHTLYDPQTSPSGNQVATATPAVLNLTEAEKHDLLHPVREWLDELDIQDPQVARFLCRLIPAQCPFERDIQLFGRKVVHIPPLCKLNPLYEQLVGLRFRALSYLADKCGEDVTPYC